MIPNSPVSITSKGTSGAIKQDLQGKSLYVALISKNLQRLGAAAPFNNVVQRESKVNTNIRTRKNSLRMRDPDALNYNDVDLAYKEPFTFQFDKQVDRVDLIEANKELKKNYKTRLELADYSSFKVKDMPNFFIDKIEERDAVSFYAPLARQLRAERFKMEPEEYTKKLREYKSGKFEHGIFVNKK